MTTKEKRVYVKSGKFSAEAKEERRNLKESKKLLRALKQEETRRKRAKKIEETRGV